MRARPWTVMATMMFEAGMLWAQAVGTRSLLIEGVPHEPQCDTDSLARQHQQ
jgi:hypothetical protein